MASISLSSLSAPFFHLPNSSISNGRPQFSVLSLPTSNSSKLHALKPSRVSASRIFAVPEVLESNAASEDETPAASTLSVGADSDKMAPKQKIRIKLRSYWVPLIEDSCKQIMDAAKTTNAKTMGPVPLPTKKRIYCVLKSPHVHKDARFHFEIRTHQRLIDILYPTAQTIDSLMQLDLPAGVDVEVAISLFQDQGRSQALVQNWAMKNKGFDNRYSALQLKYAIGDSQKSNPRLWWTS
ncbi:30S ribosomal protein S10 [Forsythia ovata]|uniref:Small ribosomal subunit protein uS10c n=1 Tax=Forsythia ovata TaxID=205694 RepID=A0ABD1S705_9LAMI